VYAFVRECLRDDVKPIKFILCALSLPPLESQAYSRSQDQSPPKRDLKVSDPAVRDLSLADLKLAPASMLLLRFEDESLNRTAVYDGHSGTRLTVPAADVDSPAPLLPSILSHATELPVPREPAPQTSGKAQASSSKPSTSSSGPKGEVKVPKWLKLGSTCALSSVPTSPLNDTQQRSKDYRHIPHGCTTPLEHFFSNQGTCYQSSSMP
jgi:tether containing UBX domain for GLUT4